MEFIFTFLKKLIMDKRHLPIYFYTTVLTALILLGFFNIYAKPTIAEIKAEQESKYESILEGLNQIKHDNEEIKQKLYDLNGRFRQRND